MSGRLAHAFTLTLLIAATFLTACRDTARDDEPELEFRDGAFTLPPDADTFVTEREPELNSGSDGYGFVLSDGLQYHGLLSFDYDSIRERVGDDDIVYATLRVYVRDTTLNPGTADRLKAHRLIQRFTESTATWLCSRRMQPQRTRGSRPVGPRVGRQQPVVGRAAGFVPR